VKRFKSYFSRRPRGMSTVRHIEIAFADSCRPFATTVPCRAGVDFDTSDRIARQSIESPVTSMTRAASRLLQWHGRRSSVYWRVPNRTRREDEQHDDEQRICPLQIARANFAESEQSSRSSSGANGAECSLRRRKSRRKSKTKQKKKIRSQGWIFLSLSDSCANARNSFPAVSFSLFKTAVHRGRSDYFRSLNFGHEFSLTFALSCNIY